MIDPRDSADSAADAIARAAATLPEPVRRALSAEGTGTYKLGAGGRDPSAPTPLDAAGRCDCSGYVAWCHGLDRYQPGQIAGDWLSCDLVYADATGPQRMWQRVEVADVRPGDALVYPGRHVNGRRVAIGHCAVLVARPAVVRTFADVEIAECQASTHPAVRRHDGSLWSRKNGIAIRLVRS